MKGNYSAPRNDLIGDILKKYEESGNLDNLPGIGKPLPDSYFSGDTFQHFQRIASDAGYKPDWLKLQHEIRNDINLVIQKSQVSNESDSLLRIAKINEKIYKFNKLCPPPLQKGSVTLENIEKTKSQW